MRRRRARRQRDAALVGARGGLEIERRVLQPADRRVDDRRARHRRAARRRLVGTAARPPDRRRPRSTGPDASAPGPTRGSGERCRAGWRARPRDRRTPPARRRSRCARARRPNRRPPPAPRTSDPRRRRRAGSPAPPDTLASARRRNPSTYAAGTKSGASTDASSSRSSGSTARSVAAGPPLDGLEQRVERRRAAPAPAAPLGRAQIQVGRAPADAGSSLRAAAYAPRPPPCPIQPRVREAAQQVRRRERRIERGRAIEMDERVGHASALQIGGGERGAHARGLGGRRARDGALESRLDARHGRVPLARGPSAMASSDDRTAGPSGPVAPPTACDRSISARTKSSFAWAAEGAGAHSSQTRAAAAATASARARHHRHPKRTE